MHGNNNSGKKSVQNYYRQLITAILEDKNAWKQQNDTVH